jgi:hypothetical protein
VYQPYPYAIDPGLLALPTSRLQTASCLAELRISAGQQADVSAALVELRWLTPSRFEAAAGAVALWEDDVSAVLGRWGLAYRFYQGPHLFARVEGGGRAWVDDVQASPGWYAGGGLTGYVGKPWILDLDGSAGTVGAARVLEATALVGIAWKVLALRVGYRALLIDEVSLSSPMLGLGVWL